MSGLTKREWFAGQALAGLLASSEAVEEFEQQDYDEYAQEAVKYANSMIKVLEVEDGAAH